MSTPVKMTTAPLPVYDTLGFVLVSGDMSYDTATAKKRFNFHGAGWKDESKRVRRPNATGYALLTGEVSGCSAIDIDDPELEHNQKLIELMHNCNMIQKTRKGYHYVYKYDARLKTTTGEHGQAMDIRNDNALLYVEPSAYHVSGQKCEYKWDCTPEDCGEESLATIPEEVIAYLQKLGPRFIKVAEAEDEETPRSPAMSVAESVTSEPKETGDSLLHKLAAEIDNNDSYDDWLRNGIICYNEGLGVDVWDTMSRKSRGYQAGACVRKWATFTGRSKKITQATWWKWLKANKTEKFNELNQQRADFMELFTTLNHDDCARYFFNTNQDSYCYCKSLNWYAINHNNVWDHVEKGVPSGFKNRIAETLKALTRDARAAVADRYSQRIKTLSPDDKQGNKDAEKVKDDALKLIATAYKCFGTSEFVNGVIAFLPSYYDEPELEQKMDMNRQVFAFKNGLFDLTTCTYRAIQPSDFVSTTAGYDMPTTSNPAVRRELKAFIHGLFENDETTAYWMNVLSYALLGYNKFEEFYTMTGSGGNGKGVCFDLLKTVFGDYFATPNITLFTKAADKAEGPSPVIVGLRSKRLLITTEPEVDDKLQVGILKRFTGGDMLEGCLKHSNHLVTYKPQFSVMFQTNDIPKLSKLDGGIQRRMRVIRFPFQFVAHPTQDYERQGDPDVKNVKCLSAEWRDEFAMMLCDNWATIKDLKSLAAPAKVREATEEYMDDNNPLKLWLAKYYTITNQETDTIRAAELKVDYLSDCRVDKMDDRKFKQLLSVNHIEAKRTNKGMAFVGLKRKAEEDIVE